ncbi:hypothetical protein Y032_0133g1794 [Ancylostoma ceylanicum]|uniref:Uncharacterized protein n=1 Tax=Ancylostoma ceylanicum TaxID=53326 RepID=A0A016T689_9BILA|nr:hypothetical protein Y032_0133g1794 [Ancylostoma ceylanicum]
MPAPPAEDELTKPYEGVDQKVHFDTSTSLLSVIAGQCLELTIVQVDVTDSLPAKKFGGACSAPKLRRSFSL